VSGTYPQWWVMRPCRYWDAARNRRFRFVRLDGPTNYCGEYPCHKFDGDTGELRRDPYGVRGHELLRQAKDKEIPVDLFSLPLRDASARPDQEGGAA
jgi:hypothetical protein